MTRQRDFYNLALELADRGWGDVAGARNPSHGRTLIEAARDFIRDPGPRGGVLYITRIPGGQLWIDVTTPLEIPEGIELRLGAGVVLVPMIAHSDTRAPTWANSAMHHVRIEGGFRAPVGRVFPTPAWFQGNAGETGQLYDLAPVRFTSRNMDRVLPEWWGAGDRAASPHDDEAIGACIRAAINDRAPLDATAAGRRLRALPIELRGTYVLARPVEITRDTQGDDGIELRGVAGGDENPTFVCAPEFPRATGVAMLLVRNFEAATLDELRFDAKGIASRCLSFSATRTNLFDRGAWLRHCGFRGATEGLVDVTVAEPMDLSVIAGGAGAPITTSEDMRFEGCRFDPTLAPSSLPTALRVSAPPTFGVEIRGCLFDGAAAAMVHARSCALSVTNCQFSNSATPRGLLSRTPENLHRDGPEGGVDIFLDVRPPDLSGPATPWVDNGRATPATLYSQDCHSTSVQFLATCRTALPNSGRDCSVVGLHHVSLEGAGREPILSVERLRPPPWDDTIIPDPIVPTKPAVTNEKAFSKAPDLGAVAIAVTAPKSPAMLFDPKVGAPNNLLKAVPSAIEIAQVFDATAQKVTAPSATAVGVSSDFFRGGDLPPLPLPAPIHWRIPTEAGQWLTLTGCRFDGPYSTSRPAVRGFAGCGPIGDLGAFSTNVASVIETDGGDRTLMTVPRVGA